MKCKIPENLCELVNAHLPDDIRLTGFEQVTKGTLPFFDHVPDHIQYFFVFCEREMHLSTTCQVSARKRDVLTEHTAITARQFASAAKKTGIDQALLESRRRSLKLSNAYSRSTSGRNLIITSRQESVKV